MPVNLLTFSGVVWIGHDCIKSRWWKFVSTFRMRVSAKLIDSMVIVLAVLRNIASLVVEFALIVFVLSNYFWEVLCLADVGGWTLCARN